MFEYYVSTCCADADQHGLRQRGWARGRDQVFRLAAVEAAVHAGSAPDGVAQGDGEAGEPQRCAARGRILVQLRALSHS